MGSDGVDKLVRYRLSASGASAAQRAGLGRYGASLVVFVAGLMVTRWLQDVIVTRAEREAEVAFEARAAQLSSALVTAFSGPQQALQSFATVLAAVPELGPEEYRRYVGLMMREHPELTGAHFLPRVEATQRVAFESQTGCALTERRGAVVRRASERSVYFPIARQSAGEDPALCGRDRGGFGENHALLEAQRTRQGAAAFLSSDEAPEATLALVYPLCAAPDGRAECPAQALRGFAELWVRLLPLIRGALGGVDTEALRVSVYDLSAAPEERLLFESRPGSAAPMSAGLGSQTPRSLRRAVDLKLVGRGLRVVVEDGEAPAFPFHRNGIWGVGLSLSILLALLLQATRSSSSLQTQQSAARRLGQYTLESQIGAGSMGTVYRARHSLLRRPTALKLLAPEHLSTHALRRFEREVQRTAMLCHPNTIAIYDFGRTDDGILYYAMEHLEGVDLQRLVAWDGRQPAARVVHLLAQAAGALAEAHSEGLIHRDIKPANLMVCVRGGVFDFVKVLDFGLVLDLNKPDLLTRRAFVGTPLYASPEAYRSPERVDARADLYALGAVGYFLLTGREVFRGERVIDVLEQHSEAKPERFSALGVHDVPPALEQLIRGCLAKDPSQRPASASVLRAELLRLQVALPWCEEDARLWWAQRGTVLAAQKRAPGPASSSLKLEIALGETLVGRLEGSASSVEPTS